MPRLNGLPRRGLVPKKPSYSFRPLAIACNRGARNVGNSRTCPGIARLACRDDADGRRCLYFKGPSRSPVYPGGWFEPFARTRPRAGRRGAARLERARSGGRPRCGFREERRRGQRDQGGAQTRSRPASPAGQERQVPACCRAGPARCQGSGRCPGSAWAGRSTRRHRAYRPRRPGWAGWATRACRRQSGLRRPRERAEAVEIAQIDASTRQAARHPAAERSSSR